MRRLIVAALVAGLLAVPAAALADGPPRVWVCKYVGTPGVDERLKDGKNPIHVSASSLPGWGGVSTPAPGEEFTDAHGRSVVVAEGSNCEEPQRYRLVRRMKYLSTVVFAGAYIGTKCDPVHLRFRVVFSDQTVAVPYGRGANPYTVLRVRTGGDAIDKVRCMRHGLA